MDIKINYLLKSIDSVNNGDIHLHRNFSGMFCSFTEAVVTPDYVTQNTSQVECQCWRPMQL